MSDQMVWIITTVLLVGFFYFRFRTPKGMQNMNTAQFKKNLDSSSNKLLVDVREPHEFKNGHIKGAQNIPLSQLSKRIQDIPRDKTLFIYCQSGMRSKQAGRILSKNGFAQLINLNGGFMSWRG